MSAGSPSAAVVPNQFSGQLHSEVLECGIGGILLVLDEAVRHCHVVQEVENVFIKFPTLRAAGIIAAELVNPVADPGGFRPNPPFCPSYYGL